MSDERPGILRYRRKPERPSSGDGMTVVRYEPGMPLDDLRAVAVMSDQRAELAEVPLPSGAVLLVRSTQLHGDRSALDWEVVVAGDYLAFSHSHGSLFSTDNRDLKQWYDLEEREA